VPANVPVAPARWPRLLSLQDSAEYLSVSQWTVRQWVAAGVLRPVILPAVERRRRRREGLRRVLLDRAALDALVEAAHGREGVLA
jgi:predicted site-specific integrase-resolvase